MSKFRAMNHIKIRHTLIRLKYESLFSDVNTAPLAVTAGKLTRVLPLKGLVLDGRNSTDDKKIEVYSWTQTG